MKNQNGYGSVFKLGGKRRKPWAVRITTDWTDEGKQVFSYLGYYKTRPEAVSALAEYNNAPYDLNANKITFEEIYERFKKEKFPKVSQHSIYGYETGFRYAEPLHKMRFKDIKKAHLQRIIDGCDRSYSVKHQIRVLFNQMFKHALENDIADKNYAEFIDMPPRTTKNKRKPFTEEEIQKLWDSINDVEGVDAALIMIYTGLRIGELLEIECSNIHLDKRYMVGGFKTNAGKNRIIPIHRKIHPLIEEKVKKGNTYLIQGERGGKMLYNNYLVNVWRVAMKELGMDHTPHECRHTFATLMDNVNANKIAIKRIMGHVTTDITDGVYTHKNIDQLLKAVDSLG